MAKSLRQSPHSSEAWRDPFEPAHTLPLWLSLRAWAHGMTHPAISNFTCSPTLPFSPSLFSPLGKLLLETWLCRHLLRVAGQHSWSGLPHSSTFPWQLGSTCLLQGGLNKSESELLGYCPSQPLDAHLWKQRMLVLHVCVSSNVPYTGHALSKCLFRK